MPAKRPVFRYYNKQTGELQWAATDRAKQVAELVKKQKSQGLFGPQLSTEQVL